MSAAAVLAPEISEPLTWAEICTRYPDEWVCIVEMDHLHPNGFGFRTARHWPWQDPARAGRPGDGLA
jgi:hypothetical protein